MAQLLQQLSMYYGYKYPSYHIQIIDVVLRNPICHLSMSREQQKVTLSNPRGQREGGLTHRISQTLITHPTNLFMYHLCSGICLGI